MLQSKGKQRIWQFPQELLQQRCYLNRIIIGQIDRVGISVNSFGEIFQSSDVAILAEDTFDGQVWTDTKVSIISASLLTIWSF